MKVLQRTLRPAVTCNYDTPVVMVEYGPYVDGAQQMVLWRCWVQKPESLTWSIRQSAVLAGVDDPFLGSHRILLSRSRSLCRHTQRASLMIRKSYSHLKQHIVHSTTFCMCQNQRHHQRRIIRLSATFRWLRTTTCIFATCGSCVQSSQLHIYLTSSNTDHMVKEK